MRRVATLVIALMLITLVLPSAAAAAPPSNDNFADAILLSGTRGSVTGTNVEATVETGELLGSVSGMNNSVWYQWSPGRKDLVATFSTCGGAEFDSIIQAYTSASTPATLATLEEAAISDDAPDCSPQSKMTLVATAGATYWIRVAGYYTYSSGPFTLTWTTAAPVRASLSITVTNTPKDPTSCRITVQGANLMPGQYFWVQKGEYYGPFLTTEAGRWSPPPVDYEHGIWSVSAPGEVQPDRDIYASDGVTLVVPKVVNRCK